MIKPAAGYRPLAYSSPEAVQTTGTVAVRRARDQTVRDRAGAVVQAMSGILGRRPEIIDLMAALKSSLAQEPSATVPVVWTTSGEE